MPVFSSPQVFILLVFPLQRAVYPPSSLLHSLFVHILDQGFRGAGEGAEDHMVSELNGRIFWHAFADDLFRSAGVCFVSAEHMLSLTFRHIMH